jgi:SAM-dependent methyltransferase
VAESVALRGVEGAQGPQPRGYTLGSNPAERDRLRRQSDDLRDHAEALIGQLGVRPGHRAIDLACGPSGVLDLLSERVGPGGQVLGLDANPAHVALAREFVAGRGLANTTVVEGDARHTGLPAGSFDVVHARLVLVTIPDPAEVVAEMVRLARPGGWVGCEEADGLFLCQPPHPAWDRLTEVFLAVWAQDGADIYLGRRLPEMLRAAGLVDVGVTVRADAYPVGHSRRTIHPDLVQSMGSTILQRGLLGQRELDETDAAVRAHLDDPGTLVIPHLYFLAWGRKPASLTAGRIQ